MTCGKEHSARGEAARIRGPLLWSASAHLVAVLFLLILGANPPRGPFRGVVDVLLIGSTGNERAAPKRQGPLSASEESQGPANLSRPFRTLPHGSSRTMRNREPAATNHPISGKEIPVPVSTDTGAPSSLAGEVQSRKEPGPEALAPDSGERSRAVGKREPVAAVPPQGMETGWSGRGTGPAPAGPSTSSPDPDQAGEISRPGTGMALLRERIQSRIVYPEEAVRRGQQGEVFLRIRIGKDGVPKEIRISRSSGVRLLDDAARRGVVNSAPLPSAPGWVEVPVRFRLR